MVHLIKLTLIIEYASSIWFFLLTLCISKNYMLPYAHCSVGYFVVVKEWKYLCFFFLTDHDQIITFDTYHLSFNRYFDS